MHVMPAEQVKLPPATPLLLRAAIPAVCIALFSAVSACRTHIEDSTLALDAATAPVIDQAADAYNAANALHNLRVDYEAVEGFDLKDPVYNPRKIDILLSQRDIAVRVAVLQSFQVYTKSLCAIVSGTNPSELTKAAQSVGGQLGSLGNSLVPAIEKAGGIAQNDLPTSSSTAVISPEIQNGITTAVDALGKFLIERKIKAELPGKIAAMDPHIQALAVLLVSDIDVLKNEEGHDYNLIINKHTASIRAAGDLGFGERREEIMKLPDFVRKGRDAQDKLTALQNAIKELAETHKQLVAQVNNSESFKQQLEDLAKAADELGSF